jgi:hypothetical protein
MADNKHTHDTKSAVSQADQKPEVKPEVKPEPKQAEPQAPVIGSLDVGYAILVQASKPSKADVRKAIEAAQAWSVPVPHGSGCALHPGGERPTDTGSV